MTTRMIHDDTAAALHPYAATEQHILLLAAKRAKLEQAQAEAERQLVHAVAREFNRGNIGWFELAKVYETIQAGGLPGRTKRWAEAIPYGYQKVKAMADAEQEQWSGTYPFQPGDIRPRMGMAVVYVLFDSGKAPCYVGSTHDFPNRMRSHTRDGKNWSSWQAYQCRNRDHAYEIEQLFLAQYKPYLNKSSYAHGRRSES